MSGGLGPGVQVLLHDLKAVPQLNGLTGRVVDYVSESGRWMVDIGLEGIKAFKADNLDIVSTPLGSPSAAPGDLISRLLGARPGVSPDVEAPVCDEHSEEDADPEAGGSVSARDFGFEEVPMPESPKDEAANGTSEKPSNEGAADYPTLPKRDSQDDLSKLSVRQIKEKLQDLGIEIPASIAEKAELVELLRRAPRIKAAREAQAQAAQEAKTMKPTSKASSGPHDYKFSAGSPQSPAGSDLPDVQAQWNRYPGAWSQQDWTACGSSCGTVSGTASGSGWSQSSYWGYPPGFGHFGWSVPTVPWGQSGRTSRSRSRGRAQRAQRAEREPRVVLPRREPKEPPREPREPPRPSRPPPPPDPPREPKDVPAPMVPPASMSRTGSTGTAWKVSRSSQSQPSAPRAQPSRSTTVRHTSPQTPSGRSATLRADAALKRWLEQLDEGRGALLKYLDALLREFGTLQEVATAMLPEPLNSSLVGHIDPSFYEALGVKALGHRLCFAKGIVALNKELSS